MDTQWRYWHVYPTQEKSFEAHAAHVRAKDLMVTAMDYTIDAKKQYAVASLRAAFEHCMDRVEPAATNPYGAHQYELLLPSVQLRLYFDAEFLVALNPTRVGNECLDALVYYIQRAYNEIPNRPVSKLERSMVHIETSHRSGVKVSYHGKLSIACGVVADMTAQRAFWARVMQLVEEDAALCKDRALLLKVKSKRRRPNGPEEVVDAWFWDGSVYTKHRLIRFLGACKFPAPGVPRSYLVPEGMARSDIDFDMWRNALVTASRQEDTVCTVLNVPRAWFALMDRYWKTPVVSDPASQHKPAAPRLSSAVIDAYLRQVYPSAALERMWTMGGRVALKYRHLALTNSKNDTYMHNFHHETLSSLLQTMHNFSAGIVHMGTATGEGSGDASDADLAYGHYALRELCFDIDVTDYDTKKNCTGVRWCACKDKAAICGDCWYFAEAAAFFLRDMLVRRMGIDEQRHIMWVFSGAKGLHVWVNAPECLFMTPLERANLLERYIDVDIASLLMEIPRGLVIHSLFDKLLVPHFVEHAIIRRSLLLPSRAESVVAMWASWFDAWIPSVTNALRNTTLITNDTESPSSSLENWKRIVEAVIGCKATEVAHVPVYWIVAQYAWPRIDSKVTTKARGTLKAPFSVHASTQIVSVPIAYPGDGCAEQSQLHTLKLTDESSVKNIQATPLFGAALAYLNHWTQGYTM